ncbi:MAG: tetratricopeptide (TPR) repeat protein [Myxococcota bacterium]|jgi:tetratricopeptide (TPR) repeat protein
MRLVKGTDLVRFVYQLINPAMIAVLFVGGAVGCETLGMPSTSTDPVRISDVDQEGDPARRASLRLVDDGLAADAMGEGSRAQSRYERALQVDASNPYAYLAIARHHIDAGQPKHALQFIDRAAALFYMRGDPPLRVEVHLLGLRGGALYDSGETLSGGELLDRARAISPKVWGDGSLSAQELR